MRRGRRPYPELLTPREQEVLDLLREGLTNPEIAARLGISLNGAKYHVSEILAKLQVESRDEAAAWHGDVTATAPHRRFYGMAAAFMHRLTAVPPYKLAAGAVIAAAAAGLAILAFGVFSMSHREADLGRIAYIHDGDVWVKDLPDGEARQLTTGGYKSNPQWSGDGEWLSFRGSEVSSGGGIGLMRGDGSEVHATIGATPGGAAWSPVSDLIAYTDDHSSLVVQKADGSTFRVLDASDDDERIYMSQPTWSPDGSMIAYVRSDGTNSPPPLGCCDDDLALWVVRPDGTNKRELYNLGDLAEWGRVNLVPIGWSADASTVHFTITSGDLRRQGTAVLWSVSVHDGSVTRSNIPVVAGNPVNGGNPTNYHSSSRSGDVVVESGTGNEEWTDKQLILVSANGDVSALTSREVVAISPAWSPDGRTLAYVSQPDMGGADDGSEVGLEQRRIWLWEADTGPRRLTGGPGQPEELPQWTRDGKKILYLSPSAERSGRTPSTVFIFDLDEGSSAPLASIDYYIDSLNGGDIPPFSNPIEFFGHNNWDAVFDWWQPSPKD
jgi:Tol biopolymer transport system component/DNA-binding CsgD family transcriptional regulator